MFRKLTLLLAALFIASGMNLWAQNEVHWSGEVGASTITTNTNIFLDGDVNLTGTITIQDNAEVFIVNNAGTDVTLTAVNDKRIFELKKGRLDIRGGSSSKVIFEGAACKSGFINATEGNPKRIDLQYVTMQNFSNTHVILYTGGNSSHTNNIVNLDHCTMRNCICSSGDYGGCIRTVGSTFCKMSFTNCLFDGNSNKIGGDNGTSDGARGAVVLWNAHSSQQCFLNIEDCTFINNHSNGRGGALVLESNGSISRCVFRNNTAGKEGSTTGKGGAVWVGPYQLEGAVDSRFVIDEETIFEGNTAYSGDGGGVYAINNAGVRFDFECNGTIVENTAKNGGGICLSCTSGKAYLQIPQGLIENNVASSCGGGVYSSGVTQAVIGGGAHPVYIKNNSAPDGGGVYVNSGNLIMNGGFVGLEGNPNIASTGNGGGVYVNKGNVTFNGGSFAYNTAAANGGGFYVNGNVEFNGGTINHNSAIKGGGFYVDGGNSTITDGTIELNNADYGGGFYSDGGTISIVSGSIDNNTATYDGGGMAVTSKSTVSVNIGSSSHIGVGPTVYNNIAERNGGGMYIEKTSSNVNYNFYGGLVDSNHSMANDTLGGGGAFYIKNATNLKISGGTVVNNTAYSNGGGFFIQGGSLTITDGVIGREGEPNRCGWDYINEVPNERRGCGGGLYMNLCSLTFNGGRVDYNRSEPTKTALNDVGDAGCGGGFYILNANLTMQGTDEHPVSISHNYANDEAGGFEVWAYKSGSNYNIKLNKAEINGNVARSHGGAGCIYGTWGTKENSSFRSRALVTFDGATISENLSQEGSGGGLYMAMNAEFTLTSGNLQHNTAQISGGGIFMSDRFLQHDGLYGDGLVKFTMNGGNIKDNIALTGMGGGGYILSHSTATAQTMTIKDVNVRENTAYLDGGGLYIKGTRNTVNFTSGDFYANTTTQGNGGAINITGGTMNLTGGNVSFNKASNGNGGGIALSEGVVFTMNGGDINNNDALLAGGGVFADGYVVTENTDIPVATTAKFTYQNGKIRQNRSRNGGGIYATHGVTVNLTYGAYIISNYAYFDSGEGSPSTARHDLATNHGIGGGVYLGSGYSYMSGSTEKYCKTNLSFTTSSGKAPGLFDNIAYYGADDIYVSGELTKVILPNICNLYFVDYSGWATGWYEDYVRLDTEYQSDNINVNLDPVPEEDPERYRVSKAEGKLTYEVAPGNIQGFSSWPMTIEDKYLCLTIGFSMNTWAKVVSTDPNSGSPTGTAYDIIDGVYHIKNKNGLAWYISHVTGYNDQLDAPVCSKAVLDADVDMSEYIWVPIGSKRVKHIGTDEYQMRPFTGEFDGQGHTIKGLWNMNLVGDYDDMGGAGLFGYIDGGTVKNTFVVGSDFIGNIEGYYGIVADTISSGNIYNCEGAGTLMASILIGGAQAPTFGGVVGLAGHDGNANIHSCIATGHLNGYKLGGLVGKVSTGSSLKNSFSNVIYEQYLDETVCHAGGLIDCNFGSVENCYARFERENNLGTMTLGLFAYDNSGSIAACYIPDELSEETLVTNGTAPSSYATYSSVNVPYLYATTNYNTITLKDGSITGFDGTSLLKTLNNWVDGNAGGNYAQWQRTTAGGYTSEGGDINDDFPVHKFSDFTSVGSEDGIVLTYGSLNWELKRKNDAENGGTIMLYANDEEQTLANNANVILYIGENISLLHGTSNGQSATKPLKAYTCQTLTKGKETWHTISSSLTKSPIGIVYGITSQVTWNSESNPCDVRVEENDEYGLFPSDITPNKFDLYSFFEPQYHWINLKRNYLSHWHMDDHDMNIEYDKNKTSPYKGTTFFDDNQLSNSYLIPGKGYLAAVNDREVLLQSYGILSSGDVKIRISNAANDGESRKGYNLIGNPYQSYLDFEQFLTINATPLAGDYYGSYLVFDAKENAYCQYKGESSKGSKAASRYINMHQGFFVVNSTVNSNKYVEVKFTNAMRTNTPGDGFRNEAPAYPLVNLVARNSEDQGDIAVVELGRPITEGAVKMKEASSGDAKVSFCYDYQEYAILFLAEETNEIPVHFECGEDSEYTLSWNTANADFSYLHLIDNKTGVDVDMLVSEGYSFTASPDDYKSRFKMVFSYTNVNENHSATLTSFAYLRDGQLCVEGEGCLELIDLTGRVLKSVRVSGQNTIAIPQVASGLYELRMVSDGEVKTQKIIL